MKLPPDRFFNWVWSVMVENRDEKDRADLEAKIYLPLPGQEASSGPWSEEEMAASWRSAKGQLS